MLAGTHYWTGSHYLNHQRKRLEAERKQAAKDRAAHRKLDRRERLVRDLAAIEERLRPMLRLRFLNEHTERRFRNLLKRRNQMVDALDKE